jgi:hypothetical protein
MSNPPVADQPVIDATRFWLERAVIGLNLCPFAKAVFVRDQIRYRVSRAHGWQALLETLQEELLLLSGANPRDIDTTLVIVPSMLEEFLEYNDFLDAANDLLEDLELDGDIQIASFHPHYQFAGTEAGDIENYSNRSPYPILHLLREASVETAVAAFPDAGQIFNRNIATLEKLGHAGWETLMNPKDNGAVS